MKHCSQCGKSYPDNSPNKFCIQCGTKMDQTVTTMQCIHCKNIVVEDLQCSICGNRYTKTELALLREVRNLRKEVNTLKTGEISYPQRFEDTEIEVIAKGSPLRSQEIPDMEVEEYRDIEVPATIEVAPVFVKPEPVVLITPKLSTPSLFSIPYNYEPILEPIVVPGLVKNQVNIKEQTFYQRFNELIEGPVLTVILVFTSIMTMIYFAQALKWNPNLQGTVFSVIGFGLLIAGYSMVIGKFPLFGPERGLGILLSITGYLLANVFTVNTGQFLVIITMNAISGSLLAYFAFKIKSEIEILTISGFTAIVPIILLNTGIYSAYLTILGFGGGLLWLLPGVIMSVKFGLNEDGYYPSLLLMILGPIIGFSFVTTSNQGIYLPGLGILISLIPVILLIRSSKLLLLDVYYKGTIAFITVFPVFIYTILGMNYVSGDFELAVLNDLIFMVGYASVLTFLFDKTVGEIAVLNEIRDQVGNFSTWIVYIVSPIVVVLFVNHPENNELLTVLCGIGLIITFLFLSELNPQLNKNKSIPQTAYFGILGYFVLNYMQNTTVDPFYFGMLTAFGLSIATVIDIKYQYHPRIAKKSTVYPVLYSILLVLSSFYKEFSFGFVLLMPTLFVSTFVLKDMPDEDRIKMNNVLMLGLTFSLSFVSRYLKIDRLEMDTGIGIEYLLYSFILFSLLSAIVLRAVRIKNRITFEFSDNEPFVQFFYNIYQFTLNNQEVVLNFSIHLLFYTVLFRISDYSQIPFLLSTITIITLATLYIARKGHWMAIIPPLWTTMQLGIFDFNIFVAIALSSYILMISFIDYLDKNSNINRMRIRVFLRDISIWYVVIQIVLTITTQSVYLVAVTILALTNSYWSDFQRSDHAITGLTTVFAPIMLYNITGLDIFGYMSYISLLGTILFYLYQDFKPGGLHFNAGQTGVTKTLADSFEISEEELDKFTGLRYLLPLIGFTYMHFFNPIHITPVIALAVLVVATSIAIVINKIHHSISIPFIILTLINIGLLDPIGYSDYFSLLIIVIAFGIMLTFLKNDKYSPLSFVTYAVISVLGGYFFDINSMLLQLSSILVITGVLMVYLFKSANIDFSYTPAISLSLSVAFSHAITGIEFIFPIVLLLLAIAPLIKRTNLNVTEDVSLTLGFVVYIISQIHLLEKSYYSPLLIITGIVAISIVQMLQNEKMTLVVSSALLVIPALVGSTLIQEWTLVIYIVGFGLQILMNLQKKIIDTDIPKYQAVVLILHIMIIQNPSIIFTILTIIIGMQFYYISKLNEDDNLNELIFVGLIGSVIISISSVFNANVLLFKTISGYFFLSLYLYRIGKVNNENQTIVAYRVLGLLSFFLLNLTISYQYYAIMAFEKNIIIGLITITSLALSYYIWSTTSNFILDTITIISLSASVPVLPETGSIAVLAVIIVNILYMSISVFSNMGEIGIEELGTFGISYLILGTIQSYIPYIQHLDGLLLTVFNYSWIVTYLVWLSSALLQVYQNSLHLKIGEIVELKLSTTTDMVFILLVGHGIVMIGWSHLASISILLLLAIAIGVGSFIAILMNSSISIEQTKPIDLLYFAFFINAILGLFAVEKLTIDLGIGIYSGVVIFIVCSLLPIVFGLIVYTNRGYRKLSLEQINRERLYVYLASAVIISILFIGFTIDKVAIIFFAMAMFTWCLLLIGAWNNEVVITTLGTIFVYVAAYILGDGYQTHIADASFAASIPIVIFIAVVVVLYLFRAELEMRFQLGHHPLLLVSIAALIVTTFQVDNLRLIGSSTSVATTIVTILFSFVGALTYIYGTKFTRGRYKALGISLIFLNLIRDLGLFFSRIAGLQGSREPNPLLSAISFAWATIMIIMVVGIRSLSQRQNLNRVLAAIFTPIERPDTSLEPQELKGGQ